MFKEKDIDISKPLIASCMTGMTATSLALATYLTGLKDTSVYYVNTLAENSTLFKLIILFVFKGFMDWILTKNLKRLTSSLWIGFLKFYEKINKKDLFFFHIWFYFFNYFKLSTELIYFIFSASAFSLAFFSLIPHIAVSALTFLNIANELNFLSASVIARALLRLVGCLIGNTSVINCVANLSSSAFILFELKI